MSEDVATKEDLKRIETALVSHVTGSNKRSERIAVALAELNMTCRHIQKDMPKQPCDHFNALRDDFDDHMEMHKDKNNTVFNNIMRVAFDLGKIGLMALLTYFIIHNMGG